MIESPSALSLGTLDATELGFVACFCLLVGALAVSWRSRRLLEGEVRRLAGDLDALAARFGGGIAELERRQRELDPLALKTRDEGLVKLLGTLLDYTRGIRGPRDAGTKNGRAHIREKS